MDYISSFGQAVQETLLNSYLKSKFENAWIRDFVATFYNQFHNILRLLDVLPSFSFPKSETMCDYYL